MSLERRKYEERAAIATPETTDPLPKVVEWDEEASHRAIMQAREIASRDPEASQYLAGQALAQPTPPTVNAYDPPRIYAEMLLVAHLKPREINEMHYTHFFGLRREVILARERAQKSFDDPQNSYDPSQDY